MKTIELRQLQCGDYNHEATLGIRTITKEQFIDYIRNDKVDTSRCLLSDDALESIFEYLRGNDIEAMGHEVNKERVMATFQEDKEADFVERYGYNTFDELLNDDEPQTLGWWDGTKEGYFVHHLG